MKKCSRCKIEKDESEFNKNSNNLDGLQARCRDCNKERLKDHYWNNEQYYRDKNQRRKERIREYINSKKLKCERCEETHVSCLEFHHQGEKEINIAQVSQYMWSFKRIDKELEKCIILCSNCHRKLHWQERQSLMV